MFQFLSFLCKSLSHLITSLILIAGGIALIVVASLLPTKPPFGTLVFVESPHLIVAGVILIIISLGPFTVYLHRINHIRHFWKNCDAQTNHELDNIREPSLGTPIPEPPFSVTTREGTEMLQNRQTESLIVRAGDVACQNEHDIEVLIDGLDKQGDWHFPDQKLIPNVQEQLPMSYSEFLSADKRESVLKEAILHDTQPAGEQLLADFGHPKYPHSP
jgi:hypothetical protein